jgi:hypothetical protein
VRVVLSHDIPNLLDNTPSVCHGLFVFFALLGCNGIEIALALADARFADEVGGLVFLSELFVDTFECVAEGANDCCEVLEDEACEAHSYAFDKSDGSVVSGASVGLNYNTHYAIVDSEDKFFACGF